MVDGDRYGGQSPVVRVGLKIRIGELGWRGRWKMRPLAVEVGSGGILRVLSGTTSWHELKNVSTGM